MASLNYYLKRAKEATGELKKEPVSVYLKFTVDRAHRFDLPTGEQIIPKFWNADKQQAKAAMPRHIELNQALSRIRDEVIQLYRDHKGVDFKTFQEMTRNLVRHGTAGAPVEKKTLLFIVNLFIEHCTKERDSKTVRKYESLRAKLEQFNPAVTLDQLDQNFYDAFRAFLFAQPNPNYKGFSLHYVPGVDYWEMRPDDKGQPVGLFDDTVYKYIVNLKAVCAWAAARGFEIPAQVKTWQVIRRAYEPITLTLAELEQIENTEFTHDLIRERLNPKRDTETVLNITRKSLETARDYLVIEARTGQRISDIKRFDPSGVANFKWTLIQRKGDRTSTRKVTVHFKGYCAPALWVFQKHNYQLPKISEQKLNDNIKRVAMMAGITQETGIYRWAQNKRIRISGPKYEFLSSHTGRKTFITLALQTMPEKMVRELAGIENYETLKHYEGRSEDAMIEKYLTEMQDTALMRKVK